MTTPTATKKSAAEIQTWLVARVATLIETTPDDVDPHAPFVRYGIDSMTTAEMMGDLEKWLGRPVDPAIVWDSPDLATFSVALAEEEA
jgi:acyl carrier protein